MKLAKGEFGKLLKACREAKSATKKEVADIIEVSSLYLTNLEDGRCNDLSVSDIVKIANHLNTSARDLMFASVMERGDGYGWLRFGIEDEEKLKLAIELLVGWDDFSKEQVNSLLTIAKKEEEKSSFQQSLF